MTTLLNANQFADVSKLVAALKEQFSNGVDAVDLVDGCQIVGTVLSRSAAEKAMARKVAEQWLANPEIIKELDASLRETPEKWE